LCVPYFTGGLKRVSLEIYRMPRDMGSKCGAGACFPGTNSIIVIFSSVHGTENN
jgi:hypothetical protein